jgi:endogenous inhibitor of DNA gyrase (YacG/DUF329 family)
MHKCEECGREFKSLHGLKCHSKSVHGRSIVDPLCTVSCCICGGTKQVKSYQLMHPRHFCSRKCQDVWRSQTLRGDRHPQWTGGPVTVACARCGKEFTVARHRTLSSQHLYCSKGCADADRTTRFVGPQHPLWKGGPEERQCAWCGKSVLRSRSYRPANTFCSDGCHYAYVHQNCSGENHYHWQGGVTPLRNAWENNGGLAWKSVCRRRDHGTCSLCGTTDVPTGLLHVHHKASFAGYPELRSEPANGVCVCKSCHAWLHSNAGRAQREAWEAEALAELGHLLTPREEVA